MQEIVTLEMLAEQIEQPEVETFAGDNSASWDYWTGFVDPVEGPSNATILARLRYRRDQMLAACDWTQVSDAPVDAQAWQVYRQALRDLPESNDDPRLVVWPTPPN